MVQLLRFCEDCQQAINDLASHRCPANERRIVALLTEIRDRLPVSRYETKVGRPVDERCTVCGVLIQENAARCSCGTEIVYYS